MKQTIITVAISAVTSLLTMVGTVWWMANHPLSLPTRTDKDGTVVRSELILGRGLVEATITHQNQAIPLIRDLYLFDPQHTTVFDNQRDRLHHQITVQTYPLPDVRISRTFKPDQKTSDSPICSQVITHISSPNQTTKSFDETGSEITGEQYQAIVANK